MISIVHGHCATCTDGLKKPRSLAILLNAMEHVHSVKLYNLDSKPGGLFSKRVSTTYLSMIRKGWTVHYKGGLTFEGGGLLTEGG